MTRLTRTSAAQGLEAWHDLFREGFDRLRFAAPVRDAEAAAHVVPANRVAHRPEFADDFDTLVGGVTVRLDRGDLAADVHMHADHGNPRHGSRLFGQAQGPVDVHAEFRLFFPGGDVPVGLRIDVRIDSEGDGSDQPESRRDAIDRSEFLLTFDVEHQNASLQGGCDFGIGLAHAGEHGLVGHAPGTQYAGEFAARDHVETVTQFGHQFEDSEVGIRFH